MRRSIANGANLADGHSPLRTDLRDRRTLHGLKVGLKEGFPLPTLCFRARAGVDGAASSLSDAGVGGEPERVGLGVEVPEGALRNRAKVGRLGEREAKVAVDLAGAQDNIPDLEPAIRVGSGDANIDHQLWKRGWGPCEGGKRGGDSDPRDEKRRL